MKTTNLIEEFLKEYENSEIIFTRKLDKNKYSTQMINYWRTHDHLKSVSHGIVCSPDKTSLCTEKCIADFDEQMGHGIRISAGSALALYGYKVPELPENAIVINLGEKFNNVPQWSNISELSRPIYTYRTNLFPDPETKFIDFDGKKIPVSSKEEAIMECIMLASTKCYRYLDVYKIFEQIDDLRVDVLQRLLETMSNKKVKRMFLFMSENLAKPWFDKLNLDKISLGKGIYVTEQRGRLVKKYNLIVPHCIFDGGEFDKNLGKYGMRRMKSRNS